MENLSMEKTGEKLIDEAEVVGSVLFTVYNDCFSVEYSGALEKQQLVGLLVAALEQLEDEDSTLVH